LIPNGAGRRVKTKRISAIRLNTIDHRRDKAIDNSNVELSALPGASKFQIERQQFANHRPHDTPIINPIADRPQ
jgi:hypothetical protein